MLQRSPENPTHAALRRAVVALLAYPRLLGLLLLLLCGLAAAQAARLQIEADLSGLVNPDSQSVADMRDYQARFDPINSDEVLLVGAPTFANEGALDALEELLIELQFVEGVETVISLQSIPAPGGSASWLSTPDMQAMPPQERLTRMRSQNPIAADLLAADMTATVVVVVPEPGVAGDAFKDHLDSSVARADPGLEVRNVGLSELHRAITRALIHDLQVLVPAAVVLCVFLTFVLFRNMRAVAVCALPPVIGVLWFFGWAGWAGIAVDPLTASLPVVLIVLCFSDCMHIYHAATVARGSGLPHGEAVLHGVVETFPAVILTTLTTIMAFATLTLQGAPALQAMGQAGIVGMLLCGMAALLAAPALMLVLGAPGPAPSGLSGVNALVGSARRLARGLRAAPVIAGVLLLGLLAMQSQSRIAFHYGEYLPDGAPVTAALERMEAAGLGSDRLFVVVEATPIHAPSELPPANARAAARVIWGAGAEGDAPWLDDPRTGDLFQRLSSSDGQGHALPVQLPIIAGDGPADAAMRALEDGLAQAGLDEVTRLVGPSHALLSEGPQLIESLRLGLYLTIVSITLLMALVYRSWRVAILALVPNLIPILGVEAWLVLAGRELTIMNVIAMTVAFGIAVDDTLHMLNRFRRASGRDVQQRIDRALAHAGPPMVATSAILVGGLLVTGFSALPGVAIYGFLIALAVVLALLADLFLLPALMRWGLK
ncbi:MAG: putative exporters of the RND superfamily [Rhodobacteraceae bacterium HLUCCA12]|nr:MAG: putative exporters of the RND superfamily [Rhodobacteraceae bacterium HLUCCA12]